MIVTVRLDLPKAINKLVLRYNTFEKVSYDKYFIASLISNTKSKLKADQMIDSISGKGSLNHHFKKLYNEISRLSEDEVKGILDNSLYPIQKIDYYSYIYIPMLNISIFDNDYKNIISGNLSLDQEFPKLLINEGGTYISHSYEEREPTAKSDQYDVNLDSEKISIKIGESYHEIDTNDFLSIIVREEIDLSKYEGEVFNQFNGKNWIQLSKSNLNNILNTKDFFYEDGNHIGIYNDYAKQSSIAFNWGLYWIKEKTYSYTDPHSKSICEKVVQVLMNSGRINEFKTKSLMNLMKNINRDTQQEVVNYILKRKESKDIAMIGLILIDKGYEKGWDKEAFQSFYKFRETKNQLMKLYEINNGFKWLINDLIDIYKTNKTVLSNEDLIKVNDYFLSCDKMRTNMQNKVGEISLSGIREKIGKMPLDEDSKKLRNQLNKFMAHFDKNIKEQDINQLKQLSNKVDSFYELFKVVNANWIKFNQENR